MIRHLVWHLEALSGTGPQGPVYTLDRDYEPRAVRIHTKNAVGADMLIDIKDDGTSIFTSLPRVTKGTSDELGDDSFSSRGLDKGSLVTLEFSSGGQGGTTVTLELTSGQEDSEVEQLAV